MKKSKLLLVSAAALLGLGVGVASAASSSIMANAATFVDSTVVDNFATIDGEVYDKIDSGNKITATNVEGALAELADAIADAESAGEITLTSASGSGDTLTTYTLSQGGEQVGVINIPKDYLVRSATIETVETADEPYAGAEVGDKYIDFVINTTDASETAQHIYLPVNDLVDAYTAGNGLALSNNEFSVVVDSSNANGLAVGANGLSMAAAAASTSGVGGSNGAMLATDKEKLNGISVEAKKVTVTTEGAGTIEIDGTSKTIVNIASDSDITTMITDVFGASTPGE